MSSLLIKHQGLPKDGECYFIQIFHDGTVYDGAGGRMAATAIEIPTHGRLIDADKFCQGLYYTRSDDFIKAGVIAFVEAAATVIPADENSMYFKR